MTMKTKFQAIESEMNAKFLERKDEIRGLLVGLLSRHHVLFLGPPGTSKSAMSNDLCSRIGGHYFKRLVSRTSTPEELFGPVSLKALENDSYQRVTRGKLPEATVAFLDEIFKCNSAVLNGTLGVLNEREFENDGQIIQVPLQMAVGASNEMPEDREELGALWDRFLLRYQVSYIKDPRNFEALLAGQSQAAATTLAEQELAQAQAEAAQVDVKKIVPTLTALRQKMTELKIPVSDRRWKQTLDIVRANAWLDGRTQAEDADLEVLAHALWTDPQQINQVRQTIMQLANPLDQEALDLLDEGMEIWQNAMNADNEHATSAGTEANAKLKRIAKRLEEMKAEAAKKGTNNNRISQALDQVVGWNKEVISKCLGIPI